MNSKEDFINNEKNKSFNEMKNENKYIEEILKEKNLVKMKIEKSLVEWQKEIWLIPELNPAAIREPKNKDEYFLKISESKTKELKQIIKNSGIDKDYVTSGKETIGKIVSNNNKRC